MRRKQLIFKSITLRVGYSDVVINDGITSMTSSTLVHGDPKDFTYKVTDAEGNDVTDTVLRADQRNARNGAPTSNKESGKVIWDLGESLLEGGATYSVSFIVWPDQDAYDLVADLNNGLRKWSGLTDIEKAQVSGSGDGTQAPFSLRTNTDADVKYKPAKEVTDSSGNSSITKGDEKTITLNPPDPMPLVDTRVNVQKQWEDSLDPTELKDFLEAHPDYKVDLDLMKGEAVYIKEILIDPVENEKIWPDSKHPDGHHISEGLMVSEAAAAKSGLAVKDSEGNAYYPTTTYDGTIYYILEKGHDYKFREEVLDYHFELEDKIFHPMVVDGVKKDVTFRDGSNEIMKMEDFNTTLTAVNSIKGGINLTKKIVDETGKPVEDKDTVFTIHGSITKDGEGISGLEYRYYGNEHHSGGSEKGTIADSSNFELTIYQGEKLRIINLPSGYTYTFYEVTRDGSKYNFQKIEGEVKIHGETLPDGENGISISGDGKELSGTSRANAEQNITVTNTINKDYKPTSVEVIKIDKNNPDKKLGGAVFQLRQIANSEASEGGVLPTEPRTKEVSQTTSVEEGKAVFTVDNDGFYELKETKAPDGYILKDDTTVYFKVDGNTVTWLSRGEGKPETWEKKESAGDGDPVTLSFDTENKKVTVTAKNEPGAALPNTGGPGTVMIYLLGIMLTGFAGAGLLMRKRKENSI